MASGGVCGSLAAMSVVTADKIARAVSVLEKERVLRASWERMVLMACRRKGDTEATYAALTDAIMAHDSDDE